MPLAHSTLLSNTKIKSAIHQLKQLTSITQQDFKHLYITCIEHLADFSDAESSLIDALENAIFALKYRRGYLLPLGADSETCFREREEWTYAVFIAALLKNLDNVIRPSLERDKQEEQIKQHTDKIILLKSLLPAEGFQWLYHNQRLWQELTQYLKGQYNKDNAFAQMIQPNKKSTVQVVKKSAIQQIDSSSLIDPDKNTDQTIFLQKIEKIQTKQINKTKTEETTSKDNEQDTISNEKANDTENIEDTDLSSTLPAIQEIDLLEKTNDTVDLNNAINFKLPDFSAQDFFDWLRSNLKDHSIVMNEQTAYIHIVKEGVLILIPQAIRAFLEAQLKRLNIHQQANLLKPQIHLTRTLKKSGLLLRTANNSTIHTYYRGHWQDRQLLSGIVAPINLFFATDKQPDTNTGLTIDPINNATYFHS